MSLKSPVDGKDKLKFVVEIIENHYENRTKDTFLKVRLSISRSYMSYTVMYRSYLNEKKLKNVRKMRLIYASNYVIQRKALKQTLDSWISTTKAHKVKELIQMAWLKPYTELNTELRTKAENNFKKLQV